MTVAKEALVVVQASLANPRLKYPTRMLKEFPGNQRAYKPWLLTVKDLERMLAVDDPYSSPKDQLSPGSSNRYGWFRM